MTKLAVLLVAAVTLQWVWCAPNQQQLQRQEQQSQALLTQIQSSSNNSVNSLQYLQAQLPIYQGKQYRNLQASDYAYSLQYVAYNLQQAIQNYQGIQYQQEIRQVYRRLSEISYSIQQAINTQPNQLQSVFRNNIQNAAEEAQRLAQIIQQNLQQEEESQPQQNLSQQELLQQRYYLNSQAIEALYGLLFASQRVQIQYPIASQNQEQIRNLLQNQISQLSNSIQNLDVSNEANVQVLSNQAYQLSQSIGCIIYRLQRQSYGQGEVVQQVSNKLSEIRGVLEQAGISQANTNAQERIQQLQSLLKVNINGAAVQIERLLELVQPNNQSNNQGQEINYLVNNVLADGLTTVQNLQSQLEINAQNNPTN